MGFNTKPLTAQQFDLLTRINDGTHDISGFKTGEFNSAKAAMDIGFKLRDMVNQQVADGDRVTASEDRDSVGDPRQNTEKGALYWAVNRVLSGAYNQERADNPLPKPKDIALALTAEQRAAIEKSVDFIRKNHNFGGNSLQNPTAFGNGETFTELRNIAAAGEKGLNTTMSRDDVILLSDAMLALQSSGQFDALDGSKIPADIKVSAAIASDVLKPVRMNANIKDVTFTEKAVDAPGTSLEDAKGQKVGRDSQIERG
jgi:hypothetical protein